MRWIQLFAAVVLFLAFGLRPVVKWGQTFSRTPVDPQIGQLHKLSSAELSLAYNNTRTLIVGGTRGIGRGIARAIVEAGGDVIVSGRSAKTGAECVDYLKEKAKSSKQQISFLVGDLGTQKSAKALVKSSEALAKSKGKFDYLIVTAAVFPDWDNLLNEEGLEKGHAIVVQGRFILYQYMKLFLKDGGRVLNVLGSGEKAASFDRDLLTAARRPKGLWENVLNWCIGLELAQIGLMESGNFSDITYVSTHPGVILTDLHVGQDELKFLDVLAPVFIPIIGISEDECGARQASILAAPQLPKGLLLVDEDMTGRSRSTELQALVPKHLSWLLSWLHERSQL